MAQRKPGSLWSLRRSWKSGDVPPSLSYLFCTSQLYYESEQFLQSYQSSTVTFRPPNLTDLNLSEIEETLDEEDLQERQELVGHTFILKQLCSFSMNNQLKIFNLSQQVQWFDNQKVVLPKRDSSFGSTSSEKYFCLNRIFTYNGISIDCELPENKRGIYVIRRHKNTHCILPRYVT